LHGAPAQGAAARNFVTLDEAGGMPRLAIAANLEVIASLTENGRQYPNRASKHFDRWLK